MTRFVSRDLKPPCVEKQQKLFDNFWRSLYYPKYWELIGLKNSKMCGKARDQEPQKRPRSKKYTLF